MYFLPVGEVPWDGILRKYAIAAYRSYFVMICKLGSFYSLYKS